MRRLFGGSDADPRKTTTRTKRHVLLLLGAALLLASVAFIPSAIAVHNEGLFELDGNPQESPATGDDWQTIFGGTSTTALASAFVNDKFDGAAGDGANDNIFTGGSTKDDLDVTGWLCKTGGAVDKNDIEHAYAAAYQQTTGTNAGDVFVYFGADKFSTSGDAQIGFWLFQGPVGCNGTNFTGAHTVGDLLVLSDFTNGGNVANIRVLKWVGSGGNTNGTLDLIAQAADCQSADPNDAVCARVNDVDGLDTVWPYTPKSNLGPSGKYPEGAFYEGGINLSALLNLNALPCFATFLAETRQSQSVDSVLEDFAYGSLSTCPDLKLEKTPDTGAFFVGDQFDWNLNVTNNGAAGQNTVVTDTIPSGLQIVGTPTFDVDPNTAGGTGTCSVAAQLVTCNVGTLAGSDGNTTGPEPDTAAVKITVKALASAIPAGTDAACATVNNTGSVTADREQQSTSGDNSDSGSVKVCRLSAAKTASPSFTRTYKWKISKSSDPTSLTMYRGDTGSVNWQVKVEPDDPAFVDSAWKVSGTITVVSPADAPDNRTVNVLDSYAGIDVPAGNISCSVAGGDTGSVSNPYADFDHGETLTCSYFLNLAGPTTGTNTATARLTNVPSGTTDFTGTATVASFGGPTNEVDKTVHVTDTNQGALGTATGAGATFNYTKNYTCDADQGTKNNTATITETGQNASAHVDIACKALTVSKTANPAFTRTYKWKISKSADPTNLTMYKGDTGAVNWQVKVEPDTPAFVDGGFQLSGNITVVAPAGAPANRTVAVSDSYAGTPVPAGDIHCSVSGGDTGAVSNPYTDMDPGETLTCSYSLSLASAQTGTNTATATLTNVPSGTTAFTGSAVVSDFGSATTEVNKTVHVTDTLQGALGTATAPNGATFSYSKNYTCNADAGTKNNTATITETNQQASASATVVCKELTVTKTATPSFKRTFQWGVDKVAQGSDGTLTLDVGQTFIQRYDVTYSVTGHTDSNWRVSGNISVVAPAGAPANRTVTVTDSYAGNAVPAANLSCSVSGGDTGAVSNPYTDMDPGETLTCSWFLDLAGALTGTNTATATLANVPSGTTAFTGSATVSSFGSPTTVADDSITVSDTFSTTLPAGVQLCTGANTPAAGCQAGSLPSGTINQANAPKTFTYYIVIGPFGSNDCGEHNVDNIASFITNTSGTTGQDAVHIVVTVPCPQGCTLTQGYWKTHSILGPAPFDDNWNNVPTPPYAPDDGDGIAEHQNETFFLSGQTWYQVFWTAPKGNAYYNLAHQYEAAVLNVLNDADPSAVTATLNSALTLLKTYTPAQIGKLKGSDPLRAQFINLAGILGSYNEGKIGPGHCDEDRLSSTTE